MDHVMIFMIYRMFIVCGGILSIYCGYRLFYISKEKQGELRVKTGANTELSMSDVAPGIFFALFGAAILVFCLLNGVTIKPSEMITTDRAVSNPESASFRNTETPGVDISNRGPEAPQRLPCISQRVGGCQ